MNTFTLCASPPQDRALRRRLRILESATALFATQGFDATSVRDVATGAELSVGLVCRYSPTREHLAWPIFDRLADELASAAVELDKATVAERFRQLMSVRIRQCEAKTLTALMGKALDPRTRLTKPPNKDSPPSRSAARCPAAFCRRLPLRHSSLLPCEYIFIKQGFDRRLPRSTFKLSQPESTCENEVAPQPKHCSPSFQLSTVMAASTDRSRFGRTDRTKERSAAVLSYGARVLLNHPSLRAAVACVWGAERPHDGDDMCGVISTAEPDAIS